MNLIEVLLQCLKNYASWGARSNKRILPLHACIAKSLCEPIFEQKLDGVFYSKNVDIYEPTHNHAYEIKLILSNYAQNANNYFESMLGATSNLQGRGIPVSQLVFLPTYLPYFDRQHRILRIERIDAQIAKYENLMRQTTGTQRPTELVFQLFDTGNLDFLTATMARGLPVDPSALASSYHVSIPRCAAHSHAEFLNRYSFRAFQQRREV